MRIHHLSRVIMLVLPGAGAGPRQGGAFGLATISLGGKRLTVGRRWFADTSPSRSNFAFKPYGYVM
jgi:hypothetical protein